MSINLLYGCCQVETCSPDLGATRRFMIDGLGAGPAEQTLAREIAQIIPDPAYYVDHLECGEAIFQVNQPSPTMTYNGQRSIHQSYLDRVGPCVTNLNFFVDDHAHAYALLSDMGAAPHIRGPSTAAPSLADYGLANTRPGGEERPFLFMDTRDLIGFDLELMEPNFQRFTAQSVQYPAFVKPRPKTGNGNLLLERLLVVVNRLEEIRDTFDILFSPASRSKWYSYREGRLARSARVMLGGIEIEYCQPLADGGYLDTNLQRFGQGIAAIVFSAQDVGMSVVCATAFAPVQLDQHFDPVGTAQQSDDCRLDCRAVTGFDVILTGRRDPFVN